VTGDITIDVEGEDNDLDASDDAFSYHLGLAYAFQTKSSFYVRPDLRFRFFDLDAEGDARYDNQDMEFNLGFGWRF